ncbi:MAG: DinB family protein [Acidimicrobiia bacterium]|nr:DinB family protein [Acidimicrobiia bacterium]
MSDLNTPEKETLSRYLDTYRGIMAYKAAGVDREAAAAPMVPSGTSLLGIVKHMAYVERWWFQAVLGRRDVEFPWSEDDPDADWRIETDESVEGVTEFYLGECEVSRAILDPIGSLDEVFPHDGGEISARRVVIHMLEETARHAGHADILPELIDGSTGWGP